MANNKIEEEVTITPIIKDLERIFNRIFRFFSSIFILIFNSIANFFWFCIKNFVLLLIFLVIGLALGYFSSELVTPKYSSELILDLNIESKSQLTSDVNYISSLIENGELETLSNLLGITEDEAGYLKEIRIEGSSTYAQKMMNVNTFYEEIDSSLLNKVELETFLQEESSEFDERYTIIIESTGERVFSKLEPQLLEFFERVPELQKLRKNTKANLVYQKEILLAEMERIDTLKQVMNEVMIEQAKSKSSGSVTNISLDQVKEQTNVNILEIYNRYLFYSKEVVLLEEKINNLDYCYEVNTHFSSYGNKSSLNRIELTLASGIFFFILGILLIVLKEAPKKD